MRKQSSAIRVAYNMLKELEKDKTKKQPRSNIPKIKTAISWPTNQIHWLSNIQSRAISHK